jgi:hypothetical protein
LTKVFSQCVLVIEMKKLGSLEQVIGEKDVNTMNNKIIYTDEPMEVGEIVEDFLPSPEELIPKKNKVQVISESKEEEVLLIKDFGEPVVIQDLF